MLYLLDKNARTVKWNGIPLHEASSAIVKEEVNGDFVLTVHYPITDSCVYQLIKGYADKSACACAGCSAF